MSYLAIVTIDLEGAEWEDYDCVNTKFEAIGLYKEVTTSTEKKVQLPNNTYAGEFNADKSSELRDNLLDKAQNAFKACRVKGEIYIAVGTSWSWEKRTV